MKAAPGALSHGHLKMPPFARASALDWALATAKTSSPCRG